MDQELITYPLVFMSMPILQLSLQGMPTAFAASAQPRIFPAQATRMTRNSQSQVIPSFNRPTSVFKPEEAKN